MKYTIALIIVATSTLIINSPEKTIPEQATAVANTICKNNGGISQSNAIFTVGIGQYTKYTYNNTCNDGQKLGIIVNCTKDNVCSKA